MAIDEAQGSAPVVCSSAALMRSLCPSPGWDERGEGERYFAARVGAAGVHAWLMMGVTDVAAADKHLLQDRAGTLFAGEEQEQEQGARSRVHPWRLLTRGSIVEVDTEACTLRVKLSENSPFGEAGCEVSVPSQDCPVFAELLVSRPDVTVLGFCYGTGMASYAVTGAHAHLALEAEAEAEAHVVWTAEGVPYLRFAESLRPLRPLRTVQPDGAVRYTGSGEVGAVDALAPGCVAARRGRLSVTLPPPKARTAHRA